MPAALPFGHQRRAQLLALPGLLLALGACASGERGGRTTLLSQQRLNQLLARQFPYTRNFSGLAELTLSAPRLGLLPASNRLSTACDLALAERLTGARYTGGIDMDYGLRWDDAQGAVRMSEVRVNRLAIDQLPRGQQQLLSQYAPRLAEHLLSDVVVYRFPADQLALARNLGLVVGPLRVLPEGLQVSLRPQGAA